MNLPREEWEKGIKAYENIKKQAEIDIALADLVIAAINTHLNTEFKGE